MTKHRTTRANGQAKWRRRMDYLWHRRLAGVCTGGTPVPQDTGETPVPQGGKASGSLHSFDRRSFLRGTAAALTGVASVPSWAAPSTRDYPQAVAATRGPRHHFFGYYDKHPWDATGRYLLAMEIGFMGRHPEPGEPLTVGMVDLQDGNRYIPFDTTLAWCWQQGTMLQWVGTAPDREVIYNSVVDGRYVSLKTRGSSGTCQEQAE